MKNDETTATASSLPATAGDQRLSPAELIEEYRDAFVAANKMGPPIVTYARGWFAIRYPNSAIGTKHRRSEIEKFRNKLLARLHERASPEIKPIGHQGAE